MESRHSLHPSISGPSDGSLESQSIFDRSHFVFLHTWFDDYVRPNWEKHTSHLRQRELSILEIGCYEGASTTWLLDNLMSHPKSRMTTVDTFEGGMEHQSQEQAQVYGLTTLEQRFRSNISRCTQSDRLIIKKMTSDEALLQLRHERATFDLIYIDASHVAIDVLHDSVLCWRMLSLGGTMIFDDFSWKGYMEDCYNPRIAIQSFLHCVAPDIETMETEGQMWVTKVPKKYEATPNLDPTLFYWEEYPLMKVPSAANGHI